MIDDKKIWFTCEYILEYLRQNHFTYSEVEALFATLQNSFIVKRVTDKLAEKYNLEEKKP